MQAERTPYSDKLYILYLGDDGDRLTHFCELLAWLPKELPIIGLKGNADPERLRRLQSLLTVRRLKIAWRIILLTGVPRKDIEILKEQSTAIIYPDTHMLFFPSDNSTIPMEQFDDILIKLQEIIYGKQDI